MLADHAQAKLFKRNKYKVAPKEQRTIDGIVFASRAEAGRYCELKMQVAKGDIECFSRQPIYELYAGIKYIADFQYIRKGYAFTTVEDVKGAATPVFRLKMKMMNAKWPGLEISIIKMDSRRADNAIMAYVNFEGKP
jgi:hypothetical protein